MINKRFCTFMVLAAFCLASFGQNNEAQKKEINEIKKNPDKYLYVEIIDSLEDLALGKAQHALKDDIEDYVKGHKELKKASNIVARNINTKSITMPRGNNRYRAFAYVRKDDIIPADNAVVMENKQTPAVSDVGTSTIEPISTKHDETLTRLVSLKRVQEILPALQQLKKDGRISDFTKYKELKADPNQYVFLICNKEGNLEAVLSEGPQRTNVKTGQPDDAINYKGRAIMCVKVNK